MGGADCDAEIAPVALGAVDGSLLFVGRGVMGGDKCGASDGADALKATGTGVCINGRLGFWWDNGDAGRFEDQGTNGWLIYRCKHSSLSCR